MSPPFILGFTYLTSQKLSSALSVFQALRVTPSSRRGPPGRKL